jgi:short-subunit dehydrogenase
MTDLAATYGPWALVTGAAIGFGEAYADFLAAAGVGVLVVDRDGDGAETTAARLRGDGAEARAFEVDLADPDAVAQLIAETVEVDVGLLVANAAASFVGPFVDRSIESLRSEIDVNVGATLALVHAFVPRLRARARGGIVLMSSQSSRRGSPLVANYAATKAYIAILAESLWDELADDGVDVLAVLPGSTRTPGWESSSPQEGLGTSNVMEPAEVIPEVFEAIGAQPSLIPGEANRANEDLMGGFERTDAVRMVGQVMREMYPG